MKWLVLIYALIGLISCSVKSQVLLEGGPTQFPVTNSYVPSFFGSASPGYVFSSYSMGGFKFQGQEDEVATEMMMQGGGGGGGGAGPGGSQLQGGRGGGPQGGQGGSPQGGQGGGPQGGQGGGSPGPSGRKKLV